MSAQLLRLSVPKAALLAFEEILTALDGALWADTKGNPDPVPLEVTLPASLTLAEIEDALAAIADAYDLPPPRFTLEPLADRDWVAESQRNLPPQTAGRFWVYGSHVTAPPPNGLIPLLVEASIAFGTGRHETTKGCLMLLSELAAAGHPVRRALDLGCGSGVLAMAIAKLWPQAEILAADNDAPSVGVTRENADLNGVGEKITALVSEGFAAPALAAAPYDLIAANILAPPLIALAPEMARHLAPGGLIVLSGLLTQEADQVEAAYVSAGLRLQAFKELGVWRALLVGR